MTDDFEAEELERERRRRLVDEAREKVESLKDLERRREEIQSLSRRLFPAAPDDAVAKWARDADARTAMREHERDEMSRPAPFDWSAFDERVEMLIERERRLLCETLGTEVGRLLAEERRNTLREAREELRELKVEIAKYASEVAALREALTVDRSKPVDLPRMPLRNVN
jgi:hypothetical protein